MDFFVLFILICVILPIIIVAHKRMVLDKTLSELANNAIEMTPKEFFKFRNTSLGGQGSYARKHNFEGVYIIFNETKGMYYIGQSIKVLDRVNTHFVGRGNGDVYADYKYGDSFKIRIISLENSDFQNLNELERAMIKKYNAYYKGYNKTRGNRK